MKLENREMYYAEMSSELIERVVRQQARKLIDSVLGQIEKDKWYAIRMTESDFEAFDADKMTKTMRMEIKPAREQTIVYKPPEMMLIPTPSLKEKLKNCIKYLKDKSGGSYEIKEIRNECID